MTSRYCVYAYIELNTSQLVPTWSLYEDCQRHVGQELLVGDQPWRQAVQDSQTSDSAKTTWEKGNLSKAQRLRTRRSIHSLNEVSFNGVCNVVNLCFDENERLECDLTRCILDKITCRNISIHAISVLNYCASFVGTARCATRCCLRIAVTLHMARKVLYLLT